MKEVKKEFARTLRQAQTEAEKKVWEILRNRKFNNYKFRRQHVIEGFILDFYCPALKLGIEVDGGIHTRRKDYDRLRQDIIESENIIIVRINNQELPKNRKLVLEKIKEKLTPHLPLPLLLGEGREPITKQ
jgi:very-short-patch-repair endonuclease